MIPRCTKPPKLFSTRNRKPRDEEKDTRFISLVCQWYWNFGVKQQVTMSELKSVGTQIATRLQIEVPPNWLSTVRKKHGVQIQPCCKTKPKNFKTDLQNNGNTMVNNTCGNTRQTIYEDVTPTEKCDSTRFDFPNFSKGQSQLTPLINPLTQPLFEQFKYSISSPATTTPHQTEKESPYLHKTHIS